MNTPQTKQLFYEFLENSQNNINFVEDFFSMKMAEICKKS